MNDTNKSDDLPPLNSAEIDLVGRLAIHSIAQRIGAHCESAKPNPSPRLLVQQPLFITLMIDGCLRGCIGHTDTEQPLWQLVPKVATAAAFSDPRFPELDANEFARCDLTVSLLSPAQTCERVEELQIGMHGFIFSRPPHKALFLPEVAPEQGWDLNQCLSQLMVKAGVRRQPKPLSDNELKQLVGAGELHFFVTETYSFSVQEYSDRR